jgi:2-iminobutanoate/2-iminopropanoate deaminase
MLRAIVEAEGYQRPPGPFAPAIVAQGSNVLVISGQVALAADGSLVGRDDAGRQARECLRNIGVLLDAAGAKPSDVVRVGVFLTDINDRSAVAEARSEFFGDHEPASTLVVAELASPEFLVELEALAVY